MGLDPMQIIEIRQLIRELAKEHTVILSSHILAEVREVCDYVLIISKGKLVASDTPDHLEHLIEGEETLELEVKGSRRQAESILGRISGVKEAKCEEQGGMTSIQIQVAEHQEIREELFYAFAEEKCPIYRMQISKATLEDVFLELTQNEREDILKEELPEGAKNEEEGADHEGDL